MSAAVVSSTHEFFKYFWVIEAAEIRACFKHLHSMYFHGHFTQSPNCGSYIFTHTISVTIVFVLNRILCILTEEKIIIYMYCVKY